MPIVQTGRLLSLATPLGADILVPCAFHGREAMSELFEFTIDMVALESDIGTASGEGIDPVRLLGQKITLSVHMTGGKPRHFNGIVARLTHGMPHGIGMRRYRATVVPEFWLTTKRRNFRVFQDKSARDIITEVLSDARLRASFSALGGTTVRSYCVQYDETDHNFISRLLEEEGLFYFFKHSASGHEMIIGDSPSHYEKAGDETVSLHTGGGFHGSALDSWEWDAGLVSGTSTQTDYDFEVPDKALLTTEATALKPATQKDLESYHYPGRYIDKGVGGKLTAARIGAEEATHRIIHASGSSAGLFAGAKSKLDAHPYGTERGSEFVCIEIAHDAHDETHLAQMAGAPGYSNRFRALQATTLFHPPRRAARELVRGPLTAVVVGPRDEEVHCDKYGRIRIQFHWDRKGAKDGKTTCWVRVAQAMAGNGWGAQFIPRVGMEVVVQFLNGDPDRPLVTGAVYNGANMPPYALPDNKFQSGIKTRSAPKGGSGDFNELRFEDKKDEEEVYFHAQKDFNRVVENDDSLEVGNDQTIKVKQNRTKTIEEGNETNRIDKGDRSTTIAQGDDALTLSRGSRTVKLDGAGNHSLKLNSGNALAELTSGNYKLHAKGGKVEIEAAMSIELKVGGSSVKLTPQGVEIKGTMVKIEGNAKADVKAPMVEVNASGVLTLKGSLTKIN